MFLCVSIIDDYFYRWTGMIILNWFACFLVPFWPILKITSVLGLSGLFAKICFISKQTQHADKRALVQSAQVELIKGPKKVPPPKKKKKKVCFHTQILHAFTALYCLHQVEMWPYQFCYSKNVVQRKKKLIQVNLVIFER